VEILDPNIVLFKDLQDLFNCADGPKFLDLLHHSTEPDNPFTGLDARVLEENILRAVFKALKELKVLRQLKINSNWLQTFPDVQQYPEIRMLKSIEK
jgi:hypothetical protein